MDALNTRACADWGSGGGSLCGNCAERHKRHKAGAGELVGVPSRAVATPPETERRTRIRCLPEHPLCFQPCCSFLTAVALLGPQLEAQLQNSELQRAVRETLNQVDLNLVDNPDLARQIRLLSVIGPAALPPDQLDRVSPALAWKNYQLSSGHAKYNRSIFLQYNGLINSMLAVYNSATICAHREPLRCGLRLDPGETSNPSQFYHSL